MDTKIDDGWYDVISIEEDAKVVADEVTSQVPSSSQPGSNGRRRTTQGLWHVIEKSYVKTLPRHRPATQRPAPRSPQAPSPSPAADEPRPFSPDLSVVTAPAVDEPTLCSADPSVIPAPNASAPELKVVVGNVLVEPYESDDDKTSVDATRPNFDVVAAADVGVELEFDIDVHEPYDVDPAPAAEANVSTPPMSMGKLVLVFGSRGGGGATTLAVNVASLFADAGKRTCVVDLDLQLGDVFVALDLEPETSIATLARDVHVEGSHLETRLARRADGLFALTQAGRVEEITGDLPAQIPDLIVRLKQHFEYVVVDGIRDFGDCCLAALDHADRIVVVVTQEVPSVRRAKRVVALLRRLGFPDSRIEVVINRYERKREITTREIADTLGLPVETRIRNDYRVAQRALDAGRTLRDISRRSSVSKDVYKWAEQILKRDDVEGSTQ